MNKLICILTALFLGLAPTAALAGGGCSNTCADDLHGGTVVSDPNPATCGLGLKVFGIGGSIFGKECPSYSIRTPKYALCGGTLNGYRCVPDGTFPVFVQHCECRGLEIPFIETGIPIDCHCGDWEPFGSVPNFTHVLCEEAQPPATDE